MVVHILSGYIGLPVGAQLDDVSQFDGLIFARWRGQGRIQCSGGWS